MSQEKQDLIGEIVNYRYEILEKIGESELFSVYKCKDQVANRLVALKILNSQFEGNLDFVSRIIENARRCHKLEHPAIAKILECDSSSGKTIIASDFAFGVSLAERFRRENTFYVPNAIDIMLKVLDALQYAHSAGIVHGDLRPQDIIISPDSEVRITDFGFAGVLRASPEISEKLSGRSIKYQAPELAEGAALSPSNDIFAFGTIFYEMLTGKPAYEGANNLAIAIKKVKAPPVSVRQMNPNVPKSLNDLIMRCLQVAPGERFANATALKRELQTIKENMQNPAETAVLGSRDYSTGVDVSQTESSRWKEVGILSLIFVSVVLVVMFSVFYFNKGAKKIAAPQLLGLTWEQASEAAKRVGLVVVDDGRGHSEMYEAGTIFEQTPMPGEFVTSGKPEVKVKISDGPSWSIVPNLVNMPEAEAREAAIKSSFNIGKVTEEYNSDVPPNSVIRQDPDSGIRRSPNSNIDIVLSKGIKPPPEPSPSTSESGNGSIKEQTFSVEVTVPEGVESAQSIRIVVKDSTGENTVIDDMQPSGTYSYEITTLGDRPRIDIYLNGKLIKTERP